MGVESTASEYVRVQSVDDLSEFTDRVDTCFIYGHGTNVVLLDRLEGRVIQVDIRGISFRKFDRNSVLVRAGAGEQWHSLVHTTLAKGVTGLENLALIPGSVGAAPFQNIGAYGRELAEVLVSVDVFDVNRQAVYTLSKDECGFEYRNSLFKSTLRNSCVVTHVTLALGSLPLRFDYVDVANELSKHPQRPVNHRRIAAAVMRVRRRKLPNISNHGNVGSFFKNPILSKATYERLRTRIDIDGFAVDGGIRVPAARLIDVCGWKGRQVGKVQVWHRQPLVLVNRGETRGQMFLEMAQRIADDVHQQFDIPLELEPVVVGSNQRKSRPLGNHNP